MNSGGYCIDTNLSRKSEGTYDPAVVTRTISHGQLCRARFGIVRMMVLPRNGTDRDGESTVGVSVKVAVVTFSTSVTSSKDVDATQTSSSFSHTSDKRVHEESSGSCHLNTVVGGPPTAGVDLSLLEVVVECLCLLDIGDGS